MDHPPGARGIVLSALHTLLLILVFTVIHISDVKVSSKMIKNFVKSKTHLYYAYFNSSPLCSTSDSFY